MKRLLRISVRGFVAAMLMGAWVGARAQAVSAVAKLDLDRFSGTWYVIARLPEKRDKRCERDSILMVALGDKTDSVQLLYACQNRKGFTESRNSDGKAEDKSGDGKLKIRTIWPFSRKDYVLALGPEYAWALLGSPNHKTMFILSRTPVLAPEVLGSIKATAAGAGFAVEKLVVQPQEAKYNAN